MNLLETSFAPFPPRRDLRFHKVGQNPLGPGILRHHEAGLLESLLAGCVEVVPLLRLVELDQHWLHRVVHRPLFPTIQVLDSRSYTSSIF